MQAVVLAQSEADRAFGHGILRALVTVRWLTLGWAAAGVAFSWNFVDRPGVCVAVIALMLAFTMLTTWLVRSQPQVLYHPAIMIAELCVAATALLADGWVFNPGRAQSLPWAWPVAVIITVGIAFGSRRGSVAAIALGVASYFGDAQTSQADWGLAASSKAALYVLAAVVAGYVAKRLRQAEREIQAARATAAVARTLHDGVLQTLAVVQRRSTDPELAALAGKQDRELRDFLFGAEATDRSLPIALREAASLVRERFDITVDVVVADDLPEISHHQVEAVAGAVGEALTNAAKHADASRVVIYAEPHEADTFVGGRTANGVFCSVKDNGAGFDPEEVAAGQGIRGSITERMDEVGGRSAIVSRVGRGTEVQLWTDGRNAP